MLDNHIGGVFRCVLDRESLASANIYCMWLPLGSLGALDLSRLLHVPGADEVGLSRPRALDIVDVEGVPDELVLRVLHGLEGRQLVARLKRVAVPVRDELQLLRLRPLDIVDLREARNGKEN